MNCNITYDLVAASYAGEDRHPDEVMKEHGITYSDWKGIPMADAIYLYDCVIPDGQDIPGFIKIGIPEFIEQHYFKQKGGDHD